MTIRKDKKDRPILEAVPVVSESGYDTSNYLTEHRDEEGRFYWTFDYGDGDTGTVVSLSGNRFGARHNKYDNIGDEGEIVAGDPDEAVDLLMDEVMSIRKIQENAEALARYQARFEVLIAEQFPNAKLFNESEGNYTICCDCGDVVVTARIKDHSFADGAGTAYGHVAPNHETIFNNDDSDDLVEDFASWVVEDLRYYDCGCGGKMDCGSDGDKAR